MHVRVIGLSWAAIGPSRKAFGTSPIPPALSPKRVPTPLDNPRLVAFWSLLGPEPHEMEPTWALDLLPYDFWLSFVCDAQTTPGIGPALLPRRHASACNFALHGISSLVLVRWCLPHAAAQQHSSLCPLPGGVPLN